MPTSNASSTGYSQQAAACSYSTTICKCIALLWTQLYVIFLHSAYRSLNQMEISNKNMAVDMQWIQYNLHAWHKDAVLVVIESSADGA